MERAGSKGGCRAGSTWVQQPLRAPLAAFSYRCCWFLQRLDGSIKGEIRKQALDHFNADGSEVLSAGQRVCG